MVNTRISSHVGYIIRWLKQILRRRQYLMTILEEINELRRESQCLFTKEQIDKALDDLASAITAKLADTNPVMLCVMIGGLIPMGHLLTRLDFPLEVDYVHATRYRGDVQGGDLQWLVKPRLPLNNRTVVVVDDILDGGLTLAAIVDHITATYSADVYTAVLVDKQVTRCPGAISHADFVGLTVEDRFIFGFGMDYQEYLRNLPEIYIAPIQDD